MALNEDYVSGIDKDSQKIQRYVSVSRTSGIYGTDCGHIGVKFFESQRDLGFERQFILSRKYEVILR